MYLVYLVLISCYIAGHFTSNTTLNYISGLVAIVAVILSFRGADRFFRIVGIVSLVGGIFFASYAGLNWLALPTYMTTMIPMLALFFVLPFINQVVFMGRYDKQMNKLLTVNVKNLGQLYRRTYVTVFLLSMFLNLAALSLVHSVLSRNMKGIQKDLADQVMSRTIIGGFCLAVMWSPMDAMLGYVVESTHVSYYSYLPWLLLCVAIIFTTEWLRSFQFKGYVVIPDTLHLTDGMIDRKVYRQIGILFIGMVIFMIGIIFINMIPNMTFLLAVTLFIIPFSFVWAFAIGKFRSYRIYSFKVWKQKGNGLSGIVVLFLSLGFFVNTLSETVFIDLVREPFLWLSQYPVLLLLSFQLILVATTLIGFNAWVGAGIIVEILPPLMEIMNPMSLGISLMTATFATTKISPGGVVLNITSHMLHRNPLVVTKWNLMFALYYGGVGTAVATLLLYI